jgi:hypothetical protein
METRAMPSQLVFSPESKRRGVASRIAGATLFFLLGAIAATALYPHVDENRCSEGNGLSDTAAQTSALGAILPRSGSPSPREGTQYTGGPIPQPTFSATQPVAAAGEAQALAHEGHPAAANGEKPDQTANRAAQKKYSHRRIGDGNHPYREQPSYWGAPGYWSPWGSGNQFDRNHQFVWR